MIVAEPSLVFVIELSKQWVHAIQVLPNYGLLWFSIYPGNNCRFVLLHYVLTFHHWLKTVIKDYNELHFDKSCFDIII